MNWNEYSEGIKQFCIYPDFNTTSDLELSYLGLGLASEAGEVAGLVKKELRDQPEFDPAKWLGEIGDVVWYTTRILDALGFTLEDAMNANFEKLSGRKERGTLTGHGDVR